MTDRPLISVVQLKAELAGARKPVLFDATSTYAGGPLIRAEGRIAGAILFDIEVLSDKASSLPHMLPSPAAFEAFARAAGVSADTDVVVYDRIGVASAPRAWWMFRVFGHKKVRVLDGGLPAWIEAGGAVEPGAPASKEAKHGDFHARLQRRLLADRDDVVEALKDGGPQVLDVRSASRFAGLAPEPRSGVRSGHMRGAINGPWQELVGVDGRLLAEDELRGVFARSGLDLDAPVITSCGSGVTACVAALALETLGRRDWAVYDGSWAEWGSRPDTEVVTGEDVR